MSRKKIFASLNAGTENSGTAPPVTPIARKQSRLRPLLGSEDLIEDKDATPVGVLGQSLDALNARATKAEEMEKKLLAGQTVVEMEPDQVEPSFVPDRIVADDEVFQNFVESIRDEGQHVPILVRPHPDNADKYQVAFGHRRLRAAIALNRSVKAVVRELTDAELVVAQGQENNERQDLSYIEKARFAARLEKQFSRDVIMSALAVYKSDLSNLISVASKIPNDLIDAIGSAHGVGRGKWQAMAKTLSSDARKVSRARKFIKTDAFLKLSSKERFNALAKALKGYDSAENGETIYSDRGDPICEIKQSKSRFTLTIDRTVSSEFAQWLGGNIEDLYRQFDSKKNEED